MCGSATPGMACAADPVTITGMAKHFTERI
jgi:hypothetical protein